MEYDLVICDLPYCLLLYLQWSNLILVSSDHVLWQNNLKKFAVTFSMLFKQPFLAMVDFRLSLLFCGVFLNFTNNALRLRCFFYGCFHLNGLC